MLFCRHYFSPLNTFMRKGKDTEPEPDPHLWLMDPDPGGPKTCGSGSPTLQKTIYFHLRAVFIFTITANREDLMFSWKDQRLKGRTDKDIFLFSSHCNYPLYLLSCHRGTHAFYCTFLPLFLYLFGNFWIHNFHFRPYKVHGFIFTCSASELSLFFITCIVCCL